VVGLGSSVHSSALTRGPGLLAMRMWVARGGHPKRK
jgi:hypothetical protein